MDPIFASFFFVQLAFLLVGLALALGSLALTVWALVACARDEPDAGNTKLLWLLVILLAGPLGALTYVLVARSRRAATADTAAAPAPAAARGW